MQVVPSITAPVISAAPQPEGVRSGIANGLRTVGDGLRIASEQVGTATDKGYIYPVDSAFTLGKVLSAATMNSNPKVHKVAGTVGTVLTFIAAYDALLVGSLMRTPGATANQVLSIVANKIDGGAGDTTAPVAAPKPLWGDLAAVQALRAQEAAEAAARAASH